jgi:tetratricopeptide (TPR) repeat protein
VLTRQYTPVWGSDVALWERGIAIDPSSGTAFTELGNAYWQAGRGEDAKRVYAEAMRLNPNVTNTHLGLGIIANAERRFADAEKYLRIVLERFPDHETARDQLALACQEQGRLEESIALFDEGRKRLPYKRGVYTQNIAVLHVQAKRAEAALAELESIRDEARSDPQLVGVWSQLGDLYRLHGRIDQAVEAYRQYLARTADRREPAILQTRSNVGRIVEQLASKSP